MRTTDAESALAHMLPSKLASDIVQEYKTIREDVATGTLGRAAPGKFVETFVQILQHLEPILSQRFEPDGLGGSRELNNVKVGDTRRR